MNSQSIKEALSREEAVVGTWVFEFNTPGIARLLASTGIDFVVYDMEHSGFGLDSIRSLIAQTRPLDLAALVRPPANEYHLIAPLLDAGASGIIVPKMESAREAARFVDTCRYFPDGHRGAAFSVAHDDFLPGDVTGKMRAANDAVICGILIETERGVKNLDKILDVKGIDLVWVGFLDLSLSLRIPGQYAHPRFKKAVRRILQVSKAHKKPVGILSTSPEQAREHLKEGFRCISYSGDIWLLQKALSEGVNAVRSEFL
ncbi:MAG: aldolase/citrate lyase family protein [Acidobacteria bacterium]|nr:aldolase/citrate lyase family protein [Acidobacteriota bacterium]